MSGPHKLARGSIDILKAYSWPGNVWELENVIERALILRRGGPITFEVVVWSSPKRHRDEEWLEKDAFPELDQINIRHIMDALRITKGMVHGPNGAAQLLGINPSTLRHRMRKLGIKAGKKTSDTGDNKIG